MSSNGGNPPTGAGTRSGKRKGAHTIQAAWEAARESNRSRERLHKQPCKGEQLKTANQTHAVSPTGPDERERTRQRPEKQRERKRGNRKAGNSAREGGRIQKLLPDYFLCVDKGGFAADLGRFGETTLPLGFRWALPRLRLPLRSPWVGADRRDAPSFRRAAPSALLQRGRWELPLDKCHPYVGHCLYEHASFEYP